MNDTSREPSRLPLRGTIAAAGTVGALALLLSFRGGPLAPAEPASAAHSLDLGEATAEQAQADTTPAHAPTGAIPADASTVEGPSTGADPTAIDPTAEATAAGTAGPTAEATVEPTVEPTEPATRTATGASVSFRWGDVQVAVSVQGDDIVDVVTLSVPTGDRRSQRISEYVEPILREEAITHDTAEVSVISGATYTSQAYAMSLQSALDQLGL